MCGAGIGPISTIIGKVVTWIAQLNQCYTLSTYISLQVKSNLMADEPITRESILDGQIQALAETRSHRLRVMTDDERIEMVQSFLDDMGEEESVLVFAYGSLIWNPALHFTRHFPGTLLGYQRRFCFWTILGRGCEDNPGLMLGLEPGGDCAGLVYEISAERKNGELDILFRREMVSYAYIPTWVDVESPQGVVKALTFVMDPDSDRHCGEIDPAKRIKHMATARGYLGNNSDYLFDLVENLKRLNISDPHMEQLDEQVKLYQSAQTANVSD